MEAQNTGLQGQEKCPQYKIQLDLTKKKLNQIEKMSETLKSKKLGFAFADVNCRLCVMMGEDLHHINSEDDFNDLIRDSDAHLAGDDENDENDQAH